MAKRKIFKDQSSIDSWDSEKPIPILSSIPISHKNHISKEPNDDEDIIDPEEFEDDEKLRSEQIFINDPKFNDKFSHLCKLSKNLYNHSIYEIRQSFFGHFEENEELRKEISNLLKYKPEGYQTKIYKLLDDHFRQSKNEDYINLPGQSSQQTIKLATDAWFSNEQSREVYKTDPEKRKDYTGKPGICGYKRTDESIMIFTNQQCHVERKEKFDERRINDPKPKRIIKNYLTFPELGIPDIPTRLPVSKSKGGILDIRHVRIIPQHIGYKVEIVYKKVISEKKIKLIERFKELSIGKFCGIDIGVNNAVAIGTNIGNHPIIIKGGFPKSINQMFNKIMSGLYSIYYRQQGFKGKDSKGQHIEIGKKLKIQLQNRYNLISDFFHKLSRFIIRYCLVNKIGTIVIGWNKGIKQNINLGKINNQNFVYIPFFKLIKNIKYKAREYGIKVIVDEESYTSLSSFLDNESFDKTVKNEKDGGLKPNGFGRIFRGLFRTNTGIKINSDVNGAYNQIRKRMPNAFDHIFDKGHGVVGGVMLHPVRLSAKDLLYNSSKSLVASCEKLPWNDVTMSTFLVLVNRSDSMKTQKLGRDKLRGENIDKI